MTWRPQTYVLGVALGAIALLVAGNGESQTLSGRLVTSLYSWERQATDSTTVSQVRANQAILLDLDRIGHRTLSVHTNMRAQGDLSGDLIDGENLRVMQLYGMWNDRTRGAQVRVGRQRLHMGPANHAVDGGWARFQVMRTWSVEGFVGVQPPLDRRADLIRSWESNRTFGGRVSTHQLDDRLSASFSAFRRDRRPIPYSAPGDYTGTYLYLPAQEEQVLGYDVAYRTDWGLDLFHQFEYERLQAAMRWINAAATLHPAGRPWNLDLEFYQRAPSLARNSLLWVFPHGDYREVSVRGGYRTSPNLRLFGRYAFLDVEDDNAQRFSGGAQFRALTATYVFRNGYSGDSDAVIATYRHIVSPKFAVDLSTGFSSYRFTEAQATRDWSWTITGNVQARVRRNLAIDLQVQNLTQDLADRPDFAGHTYDVRSYLKVSYWFSTGRSTRSAF